MENINNSNNSNNRKKKEILFNSFKLWFVSILIITLLYWLYKYLRDDYLMDILKKHKVECLQSITPKYPPPLLNFTN